MKFTVMRSDIVSAVQNVSRAVSTKATLPALEGILIKSYDNKLTLSGYDLELAITTSIDATVSNEGEIVVGAKLFLEIVRKLPEEIVTFETDERMIIYINSGNASYQIVGISSMEYPEMPEFAALDEIKISAGVLHNMIRQTIYAVSDNINKPIYTGSLFDIKEKIMRIVAIDGYRMAIRQENIDTEVEQRFIVPGKMQSEILKLINDDEKEVLIVVGQRHVSFTIDNYSVVSRLIEGNFLDYRTTVPKGEETVIRINTRSLISSVDRIALITSDRVQSPVRFSITKDEIKLSCKTAVGRANDEIPVSTIGKEVEIGFNNKYVLEALRNTECDEVTLVLNGSLSPMIIRPVAGEEFIFLVVPMRLNDEI
ncbi:MAG: DNA polymerase III subunit beta [Ruminococcus sp.]|nr:DNA polymerase III subunit beta [Ruminococcus sp.]